MTHANHIAETIKVATGEMQKKQLAELLGLRPDQLSKQLPSRYERAIAQLQEKCKSLQAAAIQSQQYASDLQADASEAQVRASELQELANQLQDENDHLQASCNKMQETCNKLQHEKSQLQESAKVLQFRYNRLQSEMKKLQGRPRIINALASPTAIFAMLLLLAAFEMVGSFHLLRDKGIALALPVSVALGFGLLVFTARGNKAGKLFCISYAMVIGAIFFDLLPFDARNTLFAFVPPSIAALIAFSRDIDG